MVFDRQLMLVFLIGDIVSRQLDFLVRGNMFGCIWILLSFK